MLIERDRKLGTGLVETVTVHNYSRTPVLCRIELFADTDFAGLFEVKDGRQDRRRSRTRRGGQEHAALESERQGHRRRIMVAFPGSREGGESLAAEVTFPAHGDRSVTISATPVPEGTDEQDGAGTGAVGPDSYRRVMRWRAAMPAADLQNEAVENVIRRSQEDLCWPS